MRAVVSLSGGMDSTTVLAEAVYQLGQGNIDSVEAVGFKYGSKHNQWENQAARIVADYYRVPFTLIDLTSAMADFQSNLLKTGDAIPEGHYQEESMRQTVVPGRNLIFISVLLGLAWSRKSEQVWLGIHAGDHFIYPDCRPTFFHAMNAAVSAGSDEKVELIAPFLHGDKKTIIKRGMELKVPYEFTRTCYTDSAVSCGRCGACQERRQAFDDCGVEDPIGYASLEKFERK